MRSRWDGRNHGCGRRCVMSRRRRRGQSAFLWRDNPQSPAPLEGRERRAIQAIAPSSFDQLLPWCGAVAGRPRCPRRSN